MLDACCIIVQFEEKSSINILASLVQLIEVAHVSNFFVLVSTAKQSSQRYVVGIGSNGIYCFFCNYRTLGID